MSRIIKIQSELIEEVDLAHEVINELKISSLSFNEIQKCFENSHYDDIQNNSLKKATALYYSKRKDRNIKKLQEALKNNGYSTTINTENNKTKIVAVQRVYA